MDTLLDIAEYGEGIGNAASVVRNNGMSAGVDAPVPTCPGWTVADLVTHIGVVHRWATSILTGEPSPTETGVEAEARSATDLFDWFDDGMVDVLNALAKAPEDLEVFFFLKAAPPSRLAWARRQCHELTIHAVDAMAARLGRVPRVPELWFRTGLALDGIDELLTGFVPRRSTRLHADAPTTIAVVPTDAEARWTVTIGPEAPVTVRDRIDRADLTLSGPASGLYLGLWNRGSLFDLEGDRRLWNRYQEQMKVTWS